MTLTRNNVVRIDWFDHNGRSKDEKIASSNFNYRDGRAREVALSHDIIMIRAVKNPDFFIWVFNENFDLLKDDRIKCLT